MNPNCYYCKKPAKYVANRLSLCRDCAPYKMVSDREPTAQEKFLYERLEETKDERDKLQAKLDHRFIDVAEQLGILVAELRGKAGRDFIRDHHGRLGLYLDELDAAYGSWTKGEPGGIL